MIESWFTGRWKKKNNEAKEELNSKYKIKERGFSHVIKQRISAKAAKIKRYVQRNQQYNQNELFANNLKQFYDNNSNKNDAKKVDPDPKEANQFWKGLWDVPASHNRLVDAKWLKDIKIELDEKPKQDDIVITNEDVKKKLN